MKFSDFQVVGPIGRGGFGEILLCKAKKNVAEIVKNEFVAIKIVSKKNKELIFAEVNVSYTNIFLVD